MLWIAGRLLEYGVRGEGQNDGGVAGLSCGICNQKLVGFW